MIAVDTNLLVRLATNDVPAEREVVVTPLELRAQGCIFSRFAVRNTWISMQAHVFDLFAASREITWSPINDDDSRE
jgi:gamma-glutamylcysteine synthetase